MKLNKLFILTLAAFTMISCVNDSNDTPDIDEPETYTFTRNGESSVTFSGQTTRIKMGHELISSMTDFDHATETSLLQMYRNSTEDGGDADPFSEAELNSATKNIKGKVAASADFFSSNTAASVEIKAQFETWISAQVNEVFPNENVQAAPGQAGQIPDGSSTRYVNAQGLEYNQLVNKGLIGALMTDQILNNYLSSAKLDEADNRSENLEKVLAENANYTTMEHYWDEAYGYLYGTSSDPSNPVPTVGDDDSFLNKYLGRVESDEDFAGISAETFQAFKLGRAAIVAGEYEIRDEQVGIIRENISKVIAIRAVHYLQSAKNAIEQQEPEYGTAFHDLSEGLGFVYSLQFTRVPGSNTSYFSKSEVDGYMEDLLDDGENGLWDLAPQTLDAISSEIASAFDFSVEEAAN